MNSHTARVSTVVLAAVALAASSVIAAERTVVVEHFTATW